MFLQFFGFLNLFPIAPLEDPCGLTQGPYVHLSHSSILLLSWMTSLSGIHQAVWSFNKCHPRGQSCDLNSALHRDLNLPFQYMITWSKASVQSLMCEKRRGQLDTMLAPMVHFLNGPPEDKHVHCCVRSWPSLGWLVQEIANTTETQTTRVTPGVTPGACRTSQRASSQLMPFAKVGS